MVERLLPLYCFGQVGYLQLYRESHRHQLIKKTQADKSSTIVLWMSYKHNETYGPKSDTALVREHAEKADGSVDPSVHSVNFARSRSHSTRRSRQADVSRQTSKARSTRQPEPNREMQTTAEETV